jgi:acyl-phosphate glycerol 3-phosphate acyltransferase
MMRLHPLLAAGATMTWLPLLLLPLAGCLIGSIPFGYLVARARGVDIFKHGSGNIGATNVGRVLGWRFGALVFALDFAKGAVPVLGARLIAADDAGWLAVLTGLAAFLGHLFPLYLGLRGGKGVATGTGVAFLLVPGPALVALAVWLVTVLATRYVSVASILAAVALATGQLTLSRDGADPRTLFCLFAAVLVVVKHRGNLVRLAERRENQLREVPAMNCLSKSLHVLAVGLWFGAAVFFSFVVAPSIFRSYEQLGEHGPSKGWFQRAPWFEKNDEFLNGPREQGTRAAGWALGPIFLWYFVLQGACGFVAAATALPWARRGGVHRWRLALLLTALTFVIAGWPIELYVEELRTPRDQKTEAYLQAPEPDAMLQKEMQAARARFGMWHGISILLNYAVIVCVFGATALAAFLPAQAGAAPLPQKKSESATPLTISGP